MGIANLVWDIMQPLCTSNCLSMVLLIICFTLALNVYNMRHANKTMSEQYTAANSEYAEAKTTLTKCEHDLKSQETVLGEVKAAVEAAKKQNSDVQANLDTCKAELDRTKAEKAEKEKAEKEKEEKEKAEKEKAEKEKAEKENAEKEKEEKANAEKEKAEQEKKEKEKTEEKKDDAPPEKKEEEEKGESQTEKQSEEKKQEDVTTKPSL